MYSDDSVASEVVDEDYGDACSDLASEIADSDDARDTETMLKQQHTNQKRKLEALGTYEEAENDYSAEEFEEYAGDTPVFQPSAPRPNFVTEAPSPTLVVRSDTCRSVNATTEVSGHDHEYDEASFEEDSRRLRGIRQTFCLAQLPESSHNLNQTTCVPASSAKTFCRTQSQVLASKDVAVATMHSKHFSLLLRKVESKFEDEVEELREKNTLLLCKERELKATLRQTKEDLSMRRARMEKKRRRAVGRRQEHERAAERVQQELATALSSNLQQNRYIEVLQSDLIELREVLVKIERQKQEADIRTMNVTEKLQTALGDFYQLTSRFENAVKAKMACEQRIEELKGEHRIRVEVVEHKCQVDVEAARQALAEEVAARTIERRTLPEIHRRVLEVEQDRFARLEAALIKQMHEIESRAAQDVLTHTAELVQANEGKYQAEQRAERRIHEEVGRIAREREAVDEQRREVLTSMVRINARFNEDRGKMEARSSELDARRSELADECAEMKACTEDIRQRTRRLEESEVLIERRRTELAAVGRESLERSHALAQRAQELAGATAERDKLRCLVKALTERSERSEQRALALERDREKLESTAHAQRLLVAKQRVQSRYFLDGTRELECILHQKHSAMGAVEKRSLVRNLQHVTIDDKKSTC